MSNHNHHHSNRNNNGGNNNNNQQRPQVEVNPPRPQSPDIASAAAPQMPSAVVTGQQNTVTVIDKRGRKIVIQKQGPIQRTRMFKVMGPTNSANQPLVGHYSMVCSVIEIDGQPEPFPTSDAQIEALLERLDEDGLEAIAEGWVKAKWVATSESNRDNVKN